VGIGARGITVGGIVAGALAAYAEVRVVDHAWTTCDAGSGAGNGFALTVSLVGLTAVHTLLVATAVATLAVVRRPPFVRPVLAGTGVAVLLLAWGFFAMMGLPLDSDACPWGEPAWWPGWLPPEVETYG
jgi:hypothetical protein